MLFPAPTTLSCIPAHATDHGPPIRPCLGGRRRCYLACQCHHGRAVRAKAERANAILLEALDDGSLAVWDTDLRTGAIAWTKPLRRLVGLDDDAGGWDEFVHPEDRDVIDRMTHPPADGPNALASAFRVVRPDGTVIRLHANVRVHRDADGEPTRIRGIVTKVTDRSGVVQAHDGSRSFLDAIVEHIPAVVVVKDAAELRFVRVNRAGQELLGFTNDELMGKSDEDLLAPHDAIARMTADREVLRAGTLVDLPAEAVVGPDGTTRILHTRKIPVMGDDGQPRFLLAISEDVTEWEVSTQELQLARDAAEEANRAKNEFLSRMSHELRTPLNAIMGFSQLLELEASGTREQQSAAQIVRAGRHLLDLINEVLDVSSIEAGRLALSMEPVPVRDVVVEVLELMSPIALQHSITVVGDRGGDEPEYVRADRQRLKQVLVNLVANAVKYNREGGVVHVKFEPRDGGRVRVCVTDTGPGLSAQEQEKLFTPFERLGADGSEIEGTGLGLVLSQRLVEAMGGTLTVESEPGAGSTFWFDLESCGEVTVELPPGIHPPPAVASQPTCRVLYIEDNLANVLLVERLLEHRPNVELIVAMHGQLGLDLAFEHQPDLLLVDINLPDLSGHTILRRLRADARTSATPIVVVSADATSSQIAACKAAGADDYLTKPFDIPAFFAVVDEFLAGTATSADPFAARSDTCPEGFEPTVLALLRRINDHEGSIDLIDAYERESRSQLRRLIQASAGGDTAGAQGLAHSMRGATGTIGAVHLAALLGRLEAAIGAGSDDVGVLVVAVSTELDRAVSVLRQLFAAA
jgi:PAS domain S-box-containing protein